GDPRFVNTSSVLDFDAHLEIGSAAIGLGYGGWDAGAFSLSTPTTPAPPPPPPAPIPPPASGTTVTLDQRIAANTDDIEEFLATGEMRFGSRDLELTSDGSTPQKVGLRFANLGIPCGATITRAYVQFESREVQ